MGVGSALLAAQLLGRHWALGVIAKGGAPYLPAPGGACLGSSSRATPHIAFAPYKSGATAGLGSTVRRL